MRILHFILFCALFINIYPQTGCQITYINNEGFIIEAGNKRIMIDALLAPDIFKNNNVNDDIINKLDENSPPFNNMDIVFITHIHRDHFSAEMTVKYLLKNDKTVLVCTKQAMTEMEKINGFNSVSNRVNPIDLPLMKKDVFKLKDLNITAFNLSHVRYMVKDEKTGELIDRFQNIQNIGYLIDLMGIKIFHAGDNILLPREEYEFYLLNKEKINVAFIEALFWPENLFESKKRVVKELINPDRIVLMHLRIGEDLSSVSKEMKDAYPSLIHFSQPLQKVKLVFDKN